MTDRHDPSRASDVPFSLLAAAALTPALAMWVIMVLRGFVLAGGFEYPLDDVYIHLAMAEQIWAGGYGVNAGEYASASSSPLYPALLALLSGGGSSRMAPFAINILALVASLLVWAYIVFQALPQKPVLRWVAVAIAAVVPVTLNFAGVTYTGMEHSLHLLATLLVLAGLQFFALTGRVAMGLVVGVALAPMLRPEGIAIALVAAGVVFAGGRKSSGVALAAIAIMPLVTFMAFLKSLGLDALPNSVMAKLGDGAGARASRFQGFADSFVTNIGQTGGLVLLVLSVLAIIAATLSAGTKKWIALGIGFAGFAHLFAGQIGWMDRYEVYALAAMAAAVMITGRFMMPLLAVTVAAGFYYVPEQLDYPDNARAIHLQQSQMARFAQGFAKVPVAVNDLGRVAWGNPNYVLDLWGLANDDARAIRLGDSPNGWAGRLADEKGVKLAMIYEKWLEDAVPAHWERIGTLRMINPAGFLGSDEVAFYSTSKDATFALRNQATLFASVLPADAVYEVVGE